MKKVIKRIICAVLALGLLGGVAALGLSGYVMLRSKDYFVTAEQAASLDADCILVLGCKVEPNGYPSHMLEDRILGGMELYDLGASAKILMSGDHGTKGYDEVNTMKTYAIDNGVPSEDIFMDHAGFSTYESMYRAAKVFEVKKVIIVTQKYHLYRAVYIARAMGIDAYGYASNPREYGNQLYHDLREILARDKDFFFCIFKPEPTYMGDAIPVIGSGDITND